MGKDYAQPEVVVSIDREGNAVIDVPDGVTLTVDRASADRYEPTETTMYDGPATVEL